MNGSRVLFYVQHLLGIGHLKRAALVARAMARRGLDVDLVSGGMPVSPLDTGGARLVQLPPLRAGEGGFSDLVDDAGRPVDDAWKARRRDRLLALFADRRPHALVIETYPFGRRQMRFELSPLLAAAAEREPRPTVIASVRDILQTGRKPGRTAEAAAVIQRYFDHVLVHGDASFAAFAETFPEAAEIAGKIHHTGFVADKSAAAGAARGDEVLVSAGGGAVGGRLLAAALGARPLTRLARAPWRLLTGGNLDAPAFAALAAEAPPGVAVERHRADFASLLGRCAVSVSQGGYNTVMDILGAGTPAVIVPFAEREQTEQPLRARRLAERGLVQVVEEAALTPRTLARAIDAALDAPPPGGGGLDLRGAGKSAALVARWIAGGNGRGAAP